MNIAAFANLIINHAQDIVRILTGKADHNNLYDHLVRGSVGTFGLMLTGTGLFLISAVLLARILGATGYGAYTYAKTLIGILSMPAVLGLEMLIVRKMAAYQAQSEWGLMVGLLRRANQIALLVSAGLILLSAAVSFGLEDRFDPKILSVFWVSLILLPLSAFKRIRHSALQGLHHVVVGQFPLMLVEPVLFIFLIWSAHLFTVTGLTASWAMVMNVVAACVSFIILVRLLHKMLPQNVKKASPAYQTSIWIRSALPLLFVSGMYIITAGTDILMLGAIKGAEPVGTYAVAKRGAGLITFFLVAVNTALAPTIASLHAKGDIMKLQRVVTKSIRVTFFVALPVAIGLIAFGKWFLHIFGRDFKQGQAALAILSFGQLMNVVMGSVALLLIMTGHEQDAAIGVGISTVLNIILNAILIPRWGLDGAAVATTCSLILLNVFLAVRVFKRLGINPTILGRVCLWRRRNTL